VGQGEVGGSGSIDAPLLVIGPADGGGLETVRDARLSWSDGRVSYAGSRDEAPDNGAGSTAVVGAVLPGFVDCHTHLPFFGWRADEFQARLAGRTYRDLQGGGGGGIYRSSRLLNQASDDDVLAFCRPLVAEMLSHGTTVFECKTGYGLSVDAELRQARMARRLANEIPQRATVTLLACHAVPEGWSREDWVAAVCRDLIPQAAAEGLADAVDVYVEDIAFTAEDLREVAAVAAAHGLRVRVHADQLGASRAAQVAAEVGAASADHLNHADGEGVRALASSDTTATVLPVSTLFLRAKPPPVADLLAAGARVAVATDFNPGTSPCLSMPEAIAVAGSLYAMPVEVALRGATHEPARVLGFGDDVGALAPGMRADFVVLDSDDVASIPYRPGHNPVVETWIGGIRVSPNAD
jgi:imidazolonepropionase